MERRLKSLNELEWELVRVDKKTGKPVGNPIPAKVPGDVISDLLNNGMLDDPYKGTNSLKCKWVNDYDWLYRARFEGRCLPGERRFLRFMGVDYEAWFRLNGNLLGSHEGMFSRVVFETTAIMEDENELEVLLVGQKNRLVEKLASLNTVGATEGVRTKTLKAQYSYGWDFAPALKNAGIWDDVFLHETGPTVIDDLWIIPDPIGLVHAEVHLNSRIAGDGFLNWRIEAVNHTESVIEGKEEVEFTASPQRIPFTVKMDNPKLWNPWEMGAPHLYRLHVEAVIEGEISDSIAENFGFRTIGYESATASAPEHHPWVVVINGKRLFLRGVNWVPMDSLLARLTPERYWALLNRAREMGANLIRVWGGGLREKRIFYDICDELGLVVWQEFPFACAFVHRYPRSARFKKLAFNEVGDIVRQLRNHPSLLMWCGGNEFNLKRNSEIVEIITKQVGVLDGTRRFHPVSPSHGDSHNWIVWHGKGNLEDYLDDEAPLISEFGLQALPVRETVEYMFGEHSWPPQKKLWQHHNIEFSKLDKYASCIPQDGSLDSYIEATQTMQAFVLKTAIERWRRLKFRKAGFGVWQLNEPWPSVSWSVIDYFGKPKKAFYALKNSMAPIMVAIYHPIHEWRKGDKVPFDVAVVNDLHEGLGECFASVMLGDKEVIKVGLKVRPNSVSAVEDLSLTLDTPPPWILRVVLSDSKGEKLAENEHNLMIYDYKRASALARTFFKLMWKWMANPK
jgi:beta-mannosidase